jgi:hypothetical protein
MFTWALLTTAGAVLTADRARIAGNQTWWGWALGTRAVLSLGPCSFGAHVVRCWRLRITVDPDQGLVLGGGRRVPWEEIESVDYREGLFRDEAAIFPHAEDVPSGKGGALGCAFLVLGIGARALLHLVVLPSLSLLSPCHSRVIARLKSGEALVFRDVEHDEELATQIHTSVHGERGASERVR